MEITCVGNNTITACPNCDDVLSVKGKMAEGMDALDVLFDEHLATHPECKAFQDALPSFEEVLARLHDHECVFGICTCICGCKDSTGCQLVFGGTLCSVCYVRDIRGDDEHGQPDDLGTVDAGAGRGEPNATP